MEITFEYFSLYDNDEYRVASLEQRTHKDVSYSLLPVRQAIRKYLSRKFQNYVSVENQRRPSLHSPPQSPR